MTRRAHARLLHAAARRLRRDHRRAAGDGRRHRRCGGRPLGTDFANVYAAGKLALAGEPAPAYDWPAHHEMQKADLRPRGHPLLRLALPAGIPAGGGGARGPAVPRRALRLPGGDADRLPRGGAPDRGTARGVAAGAGVPGRVRQYHARPQRLHHGGATRRGAARAGPTSAARGRADGVHRLQAAVRAARAAGARGHRALAHDRRGGRDHARDRRADLGRVRRRRVRRLLAVAADDPAGDPGRRAGVLQDPGVYAALRQPACPARCQCGADGDDARSWRWRWSRCGARRPPSSSRPPRS